MLNIDNLKTNKMITLIQREIKELRHEITAMDFTCSMNNLKVTKLDKNK